MLARGHAAQQLSEACQGCVAPVSGDSKPRKVTASQCSSSCEKSPNRAKQLNIIATSINSNTAVAVAQLSSHTSFAHVFTHIWSPSAGEGGRVCWAWRRGPLQGPPAGQAAAFGLLWGSAAIRLLLVVAGGAFTDIDYVVFTDAARYVAQGESPYLRATYRYSPLLAWLLVPNVLLTPLWGKLLFSACDILVGLLVSRLVKQQGGSEAAACAAAAAWLYNPWTFTISTRGSCDVLVVLLLLWTLSCLLEGKAASAAAAYGLAVHMRIYPIIYAPSIVLFLAARSLLKQQQLRRGKAVAAAAGAGTAQAGAAGGEAAAAKEEVSEATANLQAVSREGPGAEEVEGRAAVESPDHEGEGTQAAQPPRGPHLVPGAAPDTLSQDPDRGAGQEGLLGDKGGGEGRVEEGAGQASGPPNTLHQAGAPAVADAGPMATGNRGSASTGSLNSTAAKASSHPAAGPVPISQPTASQGCKAAWRPPPLTLASQPLRQREAVLLSVLLHGTLFGLMSGGCFLLLGWLCWRAYGQAFLDQAFLHHLSRQDHRHNFSIYFYDIYLSYAAHPPPSPGTCLQPGICSQPWGSSQQPGPPEDPAAHPPDSPLAALPPDLAAQLPPSLQWLVALAMLLLSPRLLAFLPQVLALAVLSWRLHEELPLCWLAQTLAFVALNKVCTAQYFVWWLSLVPLVLQHIAWPPPRGLLLAAGAWAAAQLHWLAWAYQLEFQGQSVYLMVWAAGLVFLAANVLVLVQLLRHTQPKMSFLRCSLDLVSRAQLRS